MPDGYSEQTQIIILSEKVDKGFAAVQLVLADIQVRQAERTVHDQFTEEQNDAQDDRLSRLENRVGDTQRMKLQRVQQVATAVGLSTVVNFIIGLFTG